ncbi:MAG: cytochrome c3 family protein [Bacteroidota bacterium]
MQVKSFLIAFLLFLNLNLSAQPAGKPLGPEASKGEALFKANCTSCHSMSSKGVGPALQGVVGRHSSEEWLVKWIRNNEKLRASGDKEAIAVFNNNGQASMNVFENLSEAEVKTIITYFKEWTPAAPPTPPVGGTPQGGFFTDSTLYILLFLIVVLIVVLLILRKTKNSLKATANALDEPEEAEEPTNFQKKIAELKKRSNPTIVKLLLTVLILGGLATYGFIFGVTEIAVQQGYAPEQPIKFSHKIHAGEYKIDCKYCHTTTEKSKQASIPGLNTCMNCHKGVQARDKYNGEISPEIKKIYAAMDYDPEKPNGEQYGPNPQPIKWVRIHNLPDHAVFNHSMHVKGAQLSCQTCHGPIQEMAVVEQYSTLQMGWCINCHRESNIDVENNPYYEELHAKIKAEKGNANSPYSKYYTKEGKINVTAAQNGALECSKCHY